MIDEKKLKRDDLCDICNSADCANCFSDSDFEKWINAQPKVGEWIPCSERLPEEYGCYIIAWFHKNKESKAQQKGKHYYEICEYSPDEGWLSDYEQCPEGYEVVAWMPLPEPWEGEE